MRFQKIIEGLAQPINDMTLYLPKRRQRKLHVGLFGYLFRGVEWEAATVDLSKAPDEKLSVTGTKAIITNIYDTIH